MGRRRRKLSRGETAHGASDLSAALVRAVEITTAKQHDAAAMAAVRRHAPGRVYADNAFAGRRAEDAIRVRGGVPQAIGPDT